MMFDKQGRPVTDAEGLAQVWFQRACEIEAATITTVERLPQQSQQRQCEARHNIVPSIESVTSHAELNGAFAMVKRGKACGNDGIVGEVLAWSAQAMTNFIHPLVFKASLLCAEPLQYKGSLLHCYQCHLHITSRCRYYYCRGWW